jgi:hypothetical protein
MPKAVEPHKRAGLSIFQDDPHARHPVGSLTVDQVTDDIECTPGIPAFVSLSPSIRKSTEKGVEYRRSTFEKCDGFGQLELRNVLHVVSRCRRIALDLTPEDETGGKVRNKIIKAATLVML